MSTAGSPQTALILKGISLTGAILAAGLITQHYCFQLYSTRGFNISSSKASAIKENYVFST